LAEEFAGKKGIREMIEMVERAREEAAILGFQESNTSHDNTANDNTGMQTM
jgi:hypothetical protein